MVMRLEEQVCSLELAKRLKEFGVKQDSLFYWWKRKDTDDPHVSGTKANARWVIGYQVRTEIYSHNIGGWRSTERISAFTVAELGEILHNLIGGISLPQRNTNGDWYNKNIISNTEANTRANMLCFLLEKGVIKHEMG